LPLPLMVNCELELGDIEIVRPEPERNEPDHSAYLNGLDCEVE